MTTETFFCDNILTSHLALDTNEVCSRLKVSRDFSLDCFSRCEKLLREHVNAKYAGVLVDATYPEQDLIDLGFLQVKSKNLYKNLNGSKKVLVFAVTLGHDVDRLLKRLALTSISEHFICDGLASALCESACDYAQTKIQGDFSCHPRFSPGYGDLPLSIQPQVLNAIKADKHLAISLDDSLLMHPTKSITAILGIKQ